MEDHSHMNHAHHETGHMSQNMDHSVMHVDHQMSLNGSSFMDKMNEMFNSSKDLHHQAENVNLHDHHATPKHDMHHSMMSMTFHGGFMETILFSWWKVTDVGEFIGSFLAIFILALLYEGLKYYRKHLLWKTYTGLQYCAVSPPDKGVANICADEPQVIQPMPHALDRNVPTMLSVEHAWQTILHGIQVLVSYMLMLVFMTYNTWLCAAVVLGSATGYFLFGWRESVVVDFTEHCH
ncbi:high affinity copper uptake protein 1-like isoform X1 [Melitaea cinxia]|uniref:high affinity copper uptake protein 1-like isoform X1 n=2 Tax=Melitaea cinxia TaxID=113334 RepID=UPI001E270086|nr:high affinity copper uptake protein 1-like isoform X1 [Melitaea cinxia]